MDSEEDFREGDLHPLDPYVRRLYIAQVGSLLGTKKLSECCRGCPIDLVAEPNDDSLCKEHPCGKKFAWYGEHIVAVNKVRNKK